MSKVVGSIIALVVAFAFGYWFAPEKVRTETKIVEVEKKKDKTTIDEKKNTVTTITETTKPDGTKVVTTVITEVEEKKTNKDKSSDTTRNEDTTKEVTKSHSRLSISALAGANLSQQLSPVYGAHVSREIIGPVSVGLWGLSSSEAGVSVGLSF